jgi:hypothetical protein
MCTGAERDRVGVSAGSRGIRRTGAMAVAGKVGSVRPETKNSSTNKYQPAHRWSSRAKPASPRSSLRQSVPATSRHTNTPCARKAVT